MADNDAMRVRGEMDDGRSGAFAEVYALVRRIPRGRVMTYGQISVLLGSRLSPRAVGWAMHGAPGGVPWQRVVNANGRCSTERLPDMPGGLQRDLLEAEGVVFRANGSIDLDRYRWTPRTSGVSRGVGAGLRPAPTSKRTRARRPSGR